MKMISFCVSLLILQISFSAHADQASKPTRKRTTANAGSKKKAPVDTFPKPPIFKDNEYAIFIEDAYRVFKTKQYEKLELSDNCFKASPKPNCQAYEFAQIKPKDLSIKVPGLNNISAIHCESIGGRNLLALDNKNNQYNFCRFSDGSMVNSWSMNYKHFPPHVSR